MDTDELRALLTLADVEDEPGLEELAVALNRLGYGTSIHQGVVKSLRSMIDSYTLRRLCQAGLDTPRIDNPVLPVPIGKPDEILHRAGLVDSKGRATTIGAWILDQLRIVEADSHRMSNEEVMAAVAGVRSYVESMIEARRYPRRNWPELLNPKQLLYVYEAKLRGLDLSWFTEDEQQTERDALAELSTSA
jgi:hypothetical protein